MSDFCLARKTGERFLRISCELLSCGLPWLEAFSAKFGNISADHD
jgi:hypothetical protein